ncbi:unnamed protein product [Auanema sp. JU1783]|nr:unnamed protein product [Auanema sp. JU1783]
MLLFFQRKLPKPPVPALNDTLDRYLEYAAVVAAGQSKSLHGTHEAVEKFRVVGQKYQKKLEEIADNEINWVNRFWLPEMYLKVPLPLPVNSNPAYIFPEQKFEKPGDMLRYASLLIRGIVDYKNGIDKKLVDREISTGKQKVHLCMDQYERILGCYREPGHTEDRQIRKNKNDNGTEHVIVMSDNQAFVVFTRWMGDLLPFADINYQLEEVVKKSKIRRDLAVPIGGITSGSRPIAAEFWRRMREVDVNCLSLSWIQNALFIVCLDEENELNNNNDEESKKKSTLSDRGKHLLTGNGSSKFGFNRWYDATIQLIVCSNGTSGFCIEHSVAEGIVIINMAESALKHLHENWNRKIISQKERNFQPKPLTWHVGVDEQNMIEEQRVIFDKLSNDLDLDVLEFNDFGKNFIKKCGVSPDGFIQLAMQLAHFRTHGYLVSTYESASLRRFGFGRVDNIRANTQEALEWVTSMVRKDVPKEKQIELLRKAAAKQAQVTSENISGLGIDNHLCALNVLARDDDNTPEIFSDPLWKDIMRFPLSTSQVTTSSSIKDTYLCYGAVVDDGYGCAYNLQDSFVIFAPSAFKSNERTSMFKFKKALCEAMKDMKILLSSP